MLYYLWYHAGGPVAEQHQTEVQTFVERLGDDAMRFRSMTYQGFFTKMLPHVPAEHDGWVAYVRERYIDTVTANHSGE